MGFPGEIRGISGEDILRITPGIDMLTFLLDKTGVYGMIEEKKRFFCIMT